MRRNISFTVLTAILFFILQTGALFCQPPGYKVSGTIDIGGSERWDYCIVDSVNHQLFVSHGSVVHTINLNTNKLSGEITGLNGVHGIAIANDFNKGYISSGRSDTVTVFDLKTLKVLSQIRVTGHNPDAIIYDPYSKRVFTFNGRSSNATAIDANTDKVAGTLPLQGKSEFAVSNLKGKMYVNIEDKNIIEVFDPKALRVLSRWSIAPCKEPTGMAIDLHNNRLFTVGRNTKMAVLDAVTGKVVAEVPIGGGVDGCAYDEASHRVFSSNGEGTLTIISQESKDNYKVLMNLPTAKGLRTLALDPKTHNIYLIGMIAGKDNRRSFGVLIVSI